MSNGSKSRKNLWIGIAAIIVLLAAALAVVLLVGSGGDAQPGADGTAATTSNVTEPIVHSEYDLYWNLDRALYDGKSEAGMSSREPAEDDLFHVRFFKDGKILELRVADRKVINSMDVQDLMGLEFDENGIVTGVISLDEMPVEKVAWQFYVQSIGGKMIKVNSSISMNGLETMLETDENTGIWDMTGQSGDIGCAAEPVQLDRVMAVANENGLITHLFIYERPNYMKSHEGECKHCKKTVTWYEWEKQGALPVNTGHYQVMADLKDVGQTSMMEDAKICLDLNGHRVDGVADERIYSLHNPGTELVIMDTSEDKTGRLVAHGTGDQGMCVWLRYGVFHLYDATLDGSDATTHLNGPTVHQASNTYFYMHSGELIGGTSAPKSNGKGGWSGGYGGALFMSANTKFVMNGGTIRGGYAKAVITKYDANGNPAGWSNGVGGNIYASGGATIELNGGSIRDGVAGNHSGNIFLHSKSQLTINYSVISNGRVMSKSNGGNLFVNTDAKVTMNGGYIRNGQTYNCAGNVYLNGTFDMNGGVISDGKILDWETKKPIEAAPSRNVFNVQGDFHMYGGSIGGGFQCIDTSDDGKETTLVVSANCVIFDESGVGPHLTLSDTSTGTKCVLMVGQLYDRAKIGVSAVQAPVFTKPTAEKNADKFVSGISESEIIWTPEGIAIGKGYACVCGSNSEDPAGHIGDCDGKQHLWAGTATLPTRSGYFYLTEDITVASQRNITLNTRQEVYLDLNGHKAMAVNGERLYLVQKDSVLGITDHVGGGVMGAGGQADNNCGGFLMQNTSTLKLYSGTLTMSEDADPSVTRGGIIESSGTVAVYGGTITGGKARVGGNISSTGKVSILGGTVKDGSASSVENGYALGGNICMEGKKAELVISGENTVISGGTVSTVKDGKSSWAPGGNIFADTGAKVTIDGGATVTGGRSSDGHNIYLSTNNTVLNLGKCTIHNTSDKSANIAVEAGTVTIDGATITNEGAGAVNVLTNNTADYVAAIYMKSGTVSGGTDGNIGLYQDDFCVMTGGTVKDGRSTYGSNFYLARNARLELQGGTVTGGVATSGSGANIALEGNAVVNMSGGTVSGGQSAGYGGNIGIYNGTTVNITGGTVTGGTAKEGGNIAVNGGSAKLNIDGAAEISKGTANGSGWAPGGNIFANGGAIVNIGGGATVSGGTATGSNPQGHNLCMDGANTTINLYNCTVHNTSNKNANIGFDAGTLNIDGATITNEGSGTVNVLTSNYAGCVAGIYMKSGTVSGGSDGNIGIYEDDFCVMTGGTVKDGRSTYGSNVYLARNARFDMSGGTISGGVATDGKGRGANVALQGSAVMNMSGGTISGGQSAGYGGNIGIYDGTTVNITGGTVTGGTAKEGGNIAVNGGSAKLNIDGAAEISKGTANGSGWAPGGNIFANGGAIVNIGGGATVSGGTATGSNPQGHNLCMDGANTTINLYNCTVHNTSNKNANIGFDAGTLNIDGATITNEGSGTVNVLTSNYAGCVAGIYMKSGTVSGGSDGNIGIYEDDFCVMTGGTVKDGRSTYGSNVYLARNARFDMSGGTISGGVATDGKGRGANVALQGSAVMNMSGGTISGGQSAGYGGNIGIYDGTTVNITGGTVTGGTAKEGGNIAVNGGSAKLNIDGAAEISKGTANGSGWAPGGNIFANGGAIVNIGGGATVSGGTATGSNPQGHNLCMDGANTTINLYNCTVHNTSNKNANIGFDAGTLNIDGATITNEGSGTVNVLTSNYAGCVAAIYMKSGTVSGGTDGNIGIYEDDFCVMTGGTVKDGSSVYGSNIYLARNARFDMSGGTISGGVGTISQGGSVALEGSAVMNMSGGTISGGQNANYGGNVGIFKNTTFNMTGGTITGGTAKQGGNVYIASGGTMVMSDGIVENGVATEGNGSGNIRVEGKLEMSGGIIRNGKVNDNADETSANVRFNGTVDMTGGHIYGRIVGSGTLNLSGSAKIYFVNANGENRYRDNNLTAGGTINIGQLNSDAVIGVMTTNTAYANGTNAFANVSSGAFVDTTQFYPRTVIEEGGKWVVSDAYEMIVSGGKLYFRSVAP